MPCFKGLAVSIHTPEGPLPEYSIQKQSRLSRISSYIPVPAPKFKAGSSKPEQSTFAISITLLQPGAAVPYSRPASTPEDPFPSQKIVGGLPNFLGERGRYGSTVGPYIPLTSSPNETVAAYIHFDGRAKEEVATLLRRGVETWVNSRWVSVPESEGGGLAEREFLFREVGLERWLNGLDLQGESKDVAARLERRRQKLEKKRRKKLLAMDSDDEDDPSNAARSRPVEQNGVLRYGDDKSSPVEDVRDSGMFSSSDEDSDDDVPDAEAAGQIKVSLFRVMASGEIKKGEYSPSFDAHDDDDDDGTQENRSGEDSAIDHTTTFAKPKTLDPKSISTQTVTGIDDPSKPYATFTFFYRGERQLQKMGILQAPSEPVPAATSSTPKRKSRQLDFSNLGPLKSKGTVGFAGYRDPTAGPSTFDNLKNGKTKGDDDDDMDSDGDEARDSNSKSSESKPKEPQNETQDDDAKATLSPEEIAKRGELAEGVKKIHLKRQLSFEPLSTSESAKPETPAFQSAESASTSTAFNEAATPVIEQSNPAKLTATTSNLGTTDMSSSIGSPFKKHRGASLTAGEGRVLFGTGNSLSEEIHPISEALRDITGRTGLGLNTDSLQPAQTPLNSPISTSHPTMLPEDTAATAATHGKDSTISALVGATNIQSSFNVEDGAAIEATEAETQDSKVDDR